MADPSEEMDFDPRNLIPVPIVFCDQEGQIVWTNSATEDLTGFSSHHLVSKPFTELFPEEKRAGIVRRAMRWRRGGEPELYLEEPIQTATLGLQWIGVRVKRVPAPAGREVFVCSLHDLQAMRDELESLQRQVSELEARIEEAAASVEMKSAFIRTISEDIRAPMSGVVGMSRFLLETELNPEQVTFAEVIENSGQQLLDVVDDLLDFSRIEAGELEMQSIDFDLRVAVETVAVTLGTRATDRNLGFSFGVDESIQSELIGDPGRFRQVILTLGEVVIEATKSGEISLRVSLAEESARGLTLQVTIEDNAKDERADSEGRMFEELSSAEPPDLRRFGSRGLSLNLCRQILSLMRGEIVQLGGLSTGLSFCVPFQKQVLPDISAVPEQIGLEGVHVIIGDPFAENRTWLSQTLTGWGCSVTPAANGEEAIEALRANAATGVDFQVAMIDLDLPGIGTEELAGAIRDDDSISRTSLMMVTSIGRRGDAERAGDQGFRAYLTKPIEPVDLRESLIELVRTRLMESGDAPLVTRHLLAERRHGERTVERGAGESSTAGGPDRWTPPARWVEGARTKPAEVAEKREEAPVPDQEADSTGSTSSVQQEETGIPGSVTSGIPELRDKDTEALHDLTQVLEIQATLAKGRIRKAVEIGNRREIEWEARSLDKMYDATGADRLSREFRVLAVLAGSGELSEIQSKWAEIESLFEEDPPTLGSSRQVA